MILFGFERETYVTFVTDSHITFHHYFIQNWDLSFETLPYPRATGDFAIFTTWDLFGSMNYAVQRVGDNRNFHSIQQIFIDFSLII